MAQLFDVLSAYPAAEALTQALPFASLMNLSRVNAEYRAILHGFPPPSAIRDGVYSSTVRPELYIGFHQTDYWRNLKAKSQLLCSEPQHTKGSDPRGCRMCSMPVCEGCIVKSSFGKKENTFQNRRRHLCVGCWSTGNRFTGCRLGCHSADPPPYISAVSAKDFCSCSAKDGWLCLECKNGQKADMHLKANMCCGEGCENTLEDDKATRRICLWCDLPLFGKPTREEARRIYDSRHLYAKLNSHMEKPAFIAGWEAAGPLWSDVLEAHYEAHGPPPRIYSTMSLSGRDQKYLRHLGEVHYDAIGITPPSATNIVKSCYGTLKYDEDFLLQFRPQCFNTLSVELASQLRHTIPDVAIKPKPQAQPRRYSMIDMPPAFEASRLRRQT